MLEMLKNLLGRNNEMKDAVVYWHDDVDLNDMMYDLELIGNVIMKPDSFRKGSRIVVVKNYCMNGEKCKIAELYVDGQSLRTLEEVTLGQFKGVYEINADV